MNKKLLFGMFAATGMLLATSCSNDELETVQSGNEAQVSFSLGLEGGIATRAISDGYSADKLVYAVYNAKQEPIAVSGSDANKQFVKENAFTNLQETVTLTLAKGQEYTVVFWAQDADCEDYDTDDLTNVQVAYTTANNNESRDAFYKAETFTVTGNAEINVELTRPFAQINVGVTAEDWNAAYASGVNVNESKVVIRNAATSINLLNGNVDGETDVIYDFATAPVQNGEKLMVDTDNDGIKEEYKWLSMCYILTDAAKTTLEDMQFTFRPKEGNDILFKEGLTNVPVQRNWRTNILGKILTGDIQFNITIDPAYIDDFNYDNTKKVTSSTDLLAQLKAAVEAGETNIVLDAYNAEIGSLNNAGASTGFTAALVPAGTTVTVRNAKVSGKSYGNDANGTLIFENCKFENANGAYSIHFDGGTGKVIFNNCELIGWSTFSSVDVELNNCSISGNGTYALVRSWKSYEMNNCTIDASNADKTDKWPDGVSADNGAVLTMTGCTMLNGAVYEYGAYPAGQTEGGSYILVDGVRLVNDATTLTEALKNHNKVLMEKDIEVDGTISSTEVGNIEIDGGNNKLTVGKLYSVNGASLTLSNMELIQATNSNESYPIYNQGGKVVLNKVTFSSDKVFALNFYGGGDVELNDCNISGNPSNNRYSCATIWCGDGRNLTVNGGTYSSIFMNVSSGAGNLSASKITLNDGTITKLILETEKNSAGTGYKSATLIQNGGTITTLVENPQNYDLTNLEKLN